MFGFRQRHDRSCELIFGDGDDVVHELLNQTEGDGIRIRVATETVGERRAWNDLDQPAGAQTGLKRARRRHFDADDATVGSTAFATAATPLMRPPPPIGDERVDIRRILEHFEAQSSTHPL